MTSMVAPLQCPTAPRRKAKPTIGSNKPALAAMLLMNHKAPCLWDDDDGSDSQDTTSLTASTSVFSEQESQEHLAHGMIRRLDMAFEEDEEEGWARITGHSTVHSTASDNCRNHSSSGSNSSSSNSSCASATSAQATLPLPPPPRRRNSIVAVSPPLFVRRCYSSDSSDMLFPSRH